MKEVEILFKLLDSKEDAKKKLNKFKFVGEKRVIDTYFFDPKRDNLKPDKKGSLKNSFRIRKKENKCAIAYKTDHLDKNNKWLYSDEHEMEVSSFETAKDIINNLGLKELTQIDNNKHIFLDDKYEIVIEDVKDLGLFLEVERLNVHDNDDINKIRKEIFELVKSLKIKVSDELHQGKPELMLRKIK